MAIKCVKKIPQLIIVLGTTTYDTVVERLLYPHREECSMNAIEQNIPKIASACKWSNQMSQVGKEKK